MLISGHQAFIQNQISYYSISTHFLKVLKWLLSLMTVLAILTTPACFANTKEVCAAYAGTAVSDYKTKVAPTCAVRDWTGPIGRWSNNYSAHYNWCLTAPTGAVESEEAARKAELRACNRQDTVAYGCFENYALPSLSNIQFNRTNHCGNTGSRWYEGKTNQETEFAHYQWCLSQPATTANHEYQLRVIYVKLCQNDPAMMQCRDYAKSAVADEAENTHLGCGFNGPAWQFNFDNHFYWCSSVNNPKVDPGAMHGQQEMRATQLNNCKAKIGGQPQPPSSNPECVSDCKICTDEGKKCTNTSYCLEKYSTNSPWQCY